MVVFDPSLHVWFSGLEDEKLDAYYEIERSFIAEDFILVSFEANDSPYGVFSRQSLAVIDRRFSVSAGRR